MTPRPFLLALAVAATAAPPAGATPPVGLETRIVLKVEALTVDEGKAKNTGVVRENEIGPGRPGTFDLTVPWPGGAGVTVHLDAKLLSLVPDGEAVLMLESNASRPGAVPVTASREIRLAEEGSGLFEVFGDGRHRLLLTLHGERVQRAVVRPPVTLGAPVRFVVGVERVDGDRVVLLETNELHTFVGQSVEYSFRHGSDETLEAVRLILLPVATTGDLVTIDAEISGALPGSGGTALISRNERIVASRQSISRVAATAGTPPAGYRFQVTPDF